VRLEQRPLVVVYNTDTNLAVATAWPYRFPEDEGQSEMDAIEDQAEWARFITRMIIQGRDDTSRRLQLFGGCRGKH